MTNNLYPADIQAAADALWADLPTGVDCDPAAIPFIAEALQKERDQGDAIRRKLLDETIRRARRETLEDVAAFVENSAPAGQDAISDALALSCASLAASIRAFAKAGGK